MAGIYIHVPFCKRRCSYCDFYSVVSTADADRYVDALLAELQMRRGEIKLDEVRTIYIGGGTPSMLSTKQLRRLMSGVAEMIDFGKVEEVTIEVNPDDVDVDYIDNVVRCGVNRVSMGVQSFVDEELKAVNRRHDSRQALEALNIIADCGIDNVSIDLIYGLPRQTLATWKQSVSQAARLHVNHISAYCLSYEEGTALTTLRDRGVIEETDEDTCIEMYNCLCAILKEAGYEHYEISNFALPGKYSRHNSAYWDGTPYLGLGAAAHSFDGERRRFNPANLKAYLEIIENGEVAFETETEEWWQQYNEMVMVKLRTKWGIDVRDVERRFGKHVADDFECKIEAFVASGAVLNTGACYALSEQGVMISDTIIRKLMIVYS